MKIAIVKSSWIKTSKTSSLNVHFWLKVIEAIKSEKIDTENDKTLVELVRRIEQAYPPGNDIEPIDIQLRKEFQKLEDYTRKSNLIRDKIALLNVRGW